MLIVPDNQRWKRFTISGVVFFFLIGIINLK